MVEWVDGLDDGWVEEWDDGLDGWLSGGIG